MRRRSTIRWRTCSIPPSARAPRDWAHRRDLQQPPDNSWDRRADFANAHKARASVARGFGEAPQQGYVGRTPVPPGELDPDLARALGIEEQDGEASSPPTPGGEGRALKAHGVA